MSLTIADLPTRISRIAIRVGSATATLMSRADRCFIKTFKHRFTLTCQMFGCKCQHTEKGQHHPQKSTNWREGAHVKRGISALARRVFCVERRRLDLSAGRSLVRL